MKRLLALALVLTGCNLEHALDNSEPDVIRQCANDSAQAVDTVHFVRCGWDPKPPSPGVPGG